MKALVTDYVHSHLLDGLRNMDYEIDYRPTITLDEVKSIIDQYHGIVINSKVKMYRDMIDLASQLKWIARLGSGLEIIDIPYAESHGISVLNSPEGNCNAVGEHALGMLLCLSNKLLQSDSQVRRMDWHREQNRGFEISGKTIGVIGYGHTGSSFASKVACWDVEVIVHDKYKHLNFTDKANFRSVAKEDILKEADIISLHLPLTAETHHYVDEDFIQKCNKKPVIINTSRGTVIDTKVLVAALESDCLRGACLDVFENEKTNTYSKEELDWYQKLYEFDNVVLSTHVAGWTHESLFKIADVLLKKLKQIQA